MVVFDGYKEFTTKDMTHKRRLKGKKGVSITFSLDMNLTVTKEVFLSDSKNKQQFIDFLGTILTNQGCQVFMKKQMQTFSLSIRQLSQHPPWIQF